jgi:hypothetical protein
MSDNDEGFGVVYELVDGFREFTLVRGSDGFGDRGERKLLSGTSALRDWLARA